MLGSAAEGTFSTARGLVQRTTSSSLPPLVTLRRALLGYRRGDVEAVLSDQHRQLTTLARSLDSVWSDREALRVQLASERAHFEAALANERERSGDLERRARLTALHVVGRAEREASRLRREADVRVSEAALRVEELLQVRERLLAELHAKVVAVADALERPGSRPAARRRSTTARSTTQMVSELTALARQPRARSGTSAP